MCLDCGESCNTAKEENVHKIEARDVREGNTSPKHRRAVDTTHEELINIDSLSDDFDIEEADDEKGGLQDESMTYSGDDYEYLGKVRVDDTVTTDDRYDIEMRIDRELPEMINHDTVKGRGRDVVDDADDLFGDDDDDTPDDDDDASGAIDDESGDDDDYVDDSFDETRDDDDDDLPEDEEDLFDVDDDADDADDYENNDKEMQVSDDDDDDNLDVDDDAENNGEDIQNDDDDTYDDVFDLDRVTNSPDNDDDDTFGVDDVVDDNFQFPEQRTIDDDDHTNDNKPEGPMRVLERNQPPIHDSKPSHKSKTSKASHYPDSKLGRLLKKHHNSDTIDEDDEENDFRDEKRKYKFPRRKGRKMLSIDETSAFEHVEEPAISGTEDQENKGNSDEGSVDDVAKVFLPSRGEGSSLESKQVSSGVDSGKQGSGSADKESPAPVEEDKIEGEDEEEEGQKIKGNVDGSDSDDDEGIKVVSLHSENDGEIVQHFEEDKIEGEEDEESEAEVDVLGV